MGSTSCPSNSNTTIPVVSTVSSLEIPSSGHKRSDPSPQMPISLWPGMFHSPVTKALCHARTKKMERLFLDPPMDAPPQSELLNKTPSQSRTTILYNFSTDFTLREQYSDPWNEARIGKLLEDLDALAGTISVKHCYDLDSTMRPLLLVTASVENIVLKKTISVEIDLKEEVCDNSDSLVLSANFIFVACDSKNGKAAPVNRLLPETEREKLLFKEAEVRNNLRKRSRGGQKSFFENGEVNRLETLLAEGRIFCDMPALADRDSILQRDTRLENSLICQPQQRNIHGRIFGGFLMHRAFELAFSTAYAFAGLLPCFLEVDHVDFLRPVDVGDFLRFKSCVLYTEVNPDQPLITIEVVAHVTRPVLRSSEYVPRQRPRKMDLGYGMWFQQQKKKHDVY